MKIHKKMNLKKKSEIHLQLNFCRKKNSHLGFLATYRKQTVWLNLHKIFKNSSAPKIEEGGVGKKNTLFLWVCVCVCYLILIQIFYLILIIGIIKSNHKF